MKENKEKPKEEKKKPKPFHNWLGGILEKLLTPVHVTVKSEYEIMAQSPRTDYYLLGEESRVAEEENAVPDDEEQGWTPEQRERLPDGIRDLKVSRVLIEFKYTESVTEEALTKAAGDWIRYRDYENLAPDKVKMIMMSSKVTQQSLLKACGYEKTEKEGVYHSQQAGYRFVDLILLNELRNTSYNAPYKLFASRQKERDYAYEQLQENKAFLGSEQLEILGEAVYFISFKSPEDIQKEMQKMTIEELMSKGTGLMEAYWAKMPAEVKLKGISEDERLDGISEEKMLKRISEEKRLDGISEEKRLDGISEEKVREYLVKITKN